MPNRIAIPETIDLDHKSETKKQSLRSSKLAPEYRLDYDENRDSQDHQETVNSRLDYLNKDLGTSKRPKQSIATPIASERVGNRFHQIKCEKYPSKHGNYDFICIDPNTPYDTIVCIDCFKDNPLKMRYFQENTELFIRFN